MKGQIKKNGYWLEDKLKDICGEITPGKRLAVILVMLLLFTVLNLYLTFTAIRDWGRKQERGDQLKIEHINGAGLLKKRQLKDLIDSDIELWNDTDSIFYNYKNDKS
jgi:hypothetical protein